METESKEKTNALISRRNFLKAGGGVAFAVAAYALLPELPVADGNAPGKGELVEQKIFAWVHLRTDGRITIYNPAAEMGQGSMTALPIILAEEMDADWSRVRIEHSPIEPQVYGRPGFGGGASMITVGSRAVSGYFDGLRIAGAQVRQMLLSNVAGKWKVPVAELTTEPSVVVHKASNRKISYGDIAEFMEIPESSPSVSLDQLKDPKDFRLIGNENVPRFDIPAKTNGSAQYSIDVRLPNMVYGVITRSPVYGSKPRLLNEKMIRSTAGILDVVVLEHGIGLIAETIEIALKAKDKLVIDWSEGAKAETHNSEMAPEEYERIAVDRNARGSSIESTGNVASAMKAAARTFSADYLNDHIYHAQMEPLNAVVSVAENGKSAEVWAGSQAHDSARASVAQALDLEIAQVKYNPQYLGGGFGRRSTSDYVVEAAELARVVKRPLKLIWTREDDIAYGMFRPMSLQRMEAGVDKTGNITAWKHTIVGTGSRLLASGARNDFYTFPNQEIELRSVDHGIRTKHWRGVAHGPNKFAIEAFIDEIAVVQKVDPYEFRRRHMKEFPRALNVLDTVAMMSDWKAKPKPGRAKGMAFGERSGSLCAGVCEISIIDGKIRVHHFWAALDAGIVVQPDNVIAQTEGCILMGLSSVLYESITIRNGRVIQSNFDDYQLLRMKDVPDSIDIKIIPSTEKPTGVGEAGLPVVGGAVANAFAALTGKRIRHMPFTADKVSRLLKESE
ncbi:MAG: molybdopterin-dependent oxidoreductase [Acidobacteriota bacterium]|nr:molybdopterin-dependent oxidoreductase [Acidobacteriota bacterium]MDH3528095.1 molybdopterin-dependent oxidoreductase [Acidobacteriota bacterium]